MLEQIEKEADNSAPGNTIAEIDSGLEATSLSPQLHSIQRWNKENKNKRKTEDTTLCQHIKVSITPDTKFKKIKETQIDSFAFSMEMIGNDIWVCCDDGIHVLSTELKELYHVPLGDMGYTRSATDTGSRVVVAAEYGLFRLSYQGKQEARSDTRDYRDVCYSSGKIFATPFEEPYGIEVYDAETCQHQRSIPVQCPDDSHCIQTLTICNQHIFIACSLAEKVYKCSLDGTMISTCGAHGEKIGEFKVPYICHTNTPEHVLVADCLNNRMQMLCDGEWYELQLEPLPQCPCDAILKQDALYVLRWPALKKSYLIKYDFK